MVVVVNVSDQSYSIIAARCLHVRSSRHEPKKTIYIGAVLRYFCTRFEICNVLDCADAVCCHST